MVKHIAVNDFAKNCVLTNLKSNISETFSLFTTNRPSIEKDNYIRDLYSIDLSDFSLTKLSLDWIPDNYFICDDTILFTRIESGETHIYTYHLTDNVTELLKVIPFKVKDLRLYKETLYFTTTIDCKSNLETTNQVFKVPSYLSHISSGINYLFKVNVSDKVYTLINDKDTDISQIDFDFVNNIIMYTAFNVENIKKVNSDIFTYNISNNETKKWTDGNYRIGYIGCLSKDKLVFMGTDLRTLSRNDNQDHYIIDMKTGDFKLFTEYKDMSNEKPGVMTDTCYSTSSPVLTKNNLFYHITVDQFKETLRSIDADGVTHSYDVDLSTIDSFAPLKDGMLVIGLNKLMLHELYLLKEGSLTKLTNFNEWLDEYTLSEPQYVGGKIDGWVIPPINFDPSKSYPGILMIHGGPKTIYTDVIAHDMQLLAANEYFVFYCNPRGSDGKGNEFSNIRGFFGEYAYEDLMNFVDRVLDLYPSIDGDRLGVTGGSYGGYMTNLIVTRTDRFKAAVSERGISDMMSAFLSSDIGYQYSLEYMDQNTPWSNEDIYKQASPIRHAHRVSTPVLFNHGLSDVRCHYLESLNMYKAILFHGVATKINLYEGECHRFIVNGKPSSKTSRYSELLNWFDIYLKEEL